MKVGYKGNAQITAGFIYAPYVPMMTVKTIMIEDFRISKGYKGEWVIHVKQHKMFDEMKEWCCVSFGVPGRNPRCCWRHDHIIAWNKDPRIFLRREQDLTVFALKWVK